MFAAPNKGEATPPTQGLAPRHSNHAHLAVPPVLPMWKKERQIYLVHDRRG
jgi:hypothetical protein